MFCCVVIRREVNEQICFPHQRPVGTSSDFPAEFLLQFGERNLNHGRPPVRAAVGQIALEQILDKFFDFEIPQRIIGLHSVATNRLGDHLFAQSHGRTVVGHAFEIIDHFAHELRRI